MNHKDSPMVCISLEQYYIPYLGYIYIAVAFHWNLMMRVDVKSEGLQHRWTSFGNHYQHV